MFAIFDINGARDSGRKRAPNMDMLMDMLTSVFPELRRIYAYTVDDSDPNTLKFYQKLSFYDRLTVKRVTPITVRNAVIDNNKDWMIALDIITSVINGDQDILLMWPTPRLAQMLARIYAEFPLVRYYLLVDDVEKANLDIVNITFKTIQLGREFDDQTRDQARGEVPAGGVPG